MLDPYGAWRVTDWLEEAKVRQIEPYIYITESEVDAITLWQYGIPAIATGGSNNSPS